MRSRADVRLHHSPLAALLGLALAAGLLTAFTVVVQGSVLQGAALRLETSAQANAAWRCGVSKGAKARADCMGVFQSTHVASRGESP